MHEAIVLWTNWCVERSTFVPYEEWRTFTLPLDTLRAIQEYETPPPSGPSPDHRMSPLEEALWVQAHAASTREWRASRPDLSEQTDDGIIRVLEDLGITTLRLRGGEIAWTSR